MLMRRNRANFPTLWNDASTSTPVRFSDWIDEVFNDLLNRPLSNNASFTPELNVYETDKEFELTVALPGMKKDDFEISYENGMLTISGERKLEHEENGRKYHRVESRFGSFSRSLPLPADVIKQDDITAKYENGVLHVNVPKAKEKAGRKIEIQ